MNVIHLLAGVMLILFGLRYLRKGFARIFGGDLLDWIQGFTHTRLRSYAGGVMAGTIMPSSTAMAFLSVEMSREGRTAWVHVLAVLMGAQTGITVLVQILTLPISGFAPLPLAIGGLLFLFSKQLRPRGIGQVCLALGFLLLGMGLISTGAKAIGSNPDTVRLFAALAAFPLLMAIAATVLTMVLQSSTASIALAIGLAATGQLTFPMLILWVVGTNIGLCLTVLVAGWAKVDARRMGWAVLILKLPLGLAIAALLVLLPPGIWSHLPGNMATQAAWTHTGFNLLAAIGLFWGNAIDRLLRRWIPDPLPGATTRPERLDPLLLQNPSLAVNAAMRESLRLMDLMHVLRESLFDGLRNQRFSAECIAAIQTRANAIHEGRWELSEFLSQITTEDLDAHDLSLKATLDDLMREIPLVVRSMERDMLNEAKALLALGPEAISGALPLLEEARKRFATLTESVAQMLLQQDPDLGPGILRQKQDNSAWMITTKRQHVRLPQPVWEIIDDLQQLNRRFAGVVYVFCSQQNLGDHLLEGV